MKEGTEGFTQTSKARKAIKSSIVRFSKFRKKSRKGVSLEMLVDERTG
jgi:hypothetical protein